MNKETQKPAKPTRLRTCARCGQSINTQTDSWEMKTSEDSQYAQGIQHVTCPPSPEIRDLPPSSPSPQEVSAGASSPAAVPVLVTMDEAAKLIRVSKGTIRNRIRSGELPAKRLRGGQTVLIDQRDVLALLEDIPPGSAV